MTARVCLEAGNKFCFCVFSFLSSRSIYCWPLPVTFVSFTKKMLHFAADVKRSMSVAAGWPVYQRPGRGGDLTLWGLAAHFLVFFRISTQCAAWLCSKLQFLDRRRDGSQQTVFSQLVRTDNDREASGPRDTARTSHSRPGHRQR